MTSKKSACLQTLDTMTSMFFRLPADFRYNDFKKIRLPADFKCNDFNVFPPAGRL
jgi:hypothetical protein